MRHIHLPSAIVMLLFVMAAGCTSNTEIIGAWKKPSMDVNVSTIMVTAMTDRVTVRETVENNLAQSFKEAGYNAVRSIDVLPPNFSRGEAPDKAELLDKVTAAQADAILTVALLDEETETRYVPGAPYQPVPRFGYYGRFWGYYNTWYPALYAPGYYEEDKVYFIETNLYNAGTEELLWSAQSETVNPRDLESFSREFARAVITQLKEDNVLRK